MQMLHRPATSTLPNFIAEYPSLDSDCLSTSTRCGTKDSMAGRLIRKWESAGLEAGQEMGKKLLDKAGMKSDQIKHTR